MARKHIGVLTKIIVTACWWIYCFKIVFTWCIQRQIFITLYSIW